MRLKTLGGMCVLATACAGFVIPLPASSVERWYSSGLYPPVQRVVTGFSNAFPVALLDVLLVGVPLLGLVFFVRDVRRSPGRAKTIGGWMLRTAIAAAALYVIFLAMWGLNYRRLPLDQKIRVDARRLTREAARDAARLSVARLNALYPEAHPPSDAYDRIDASLATAFAGAMSELGVAGPVVPARPKRTLLNLYFRPAAVAGMTDPFFLETLIESDLLAVERPFVIAHEWSHLAGFADEGEANFGGWLTCARGNVPAQYSGWLFLFGELAGSLPRSDRGDLTAGLAPGPRADLRAIAARLARDVKPSVSAAGWRVYDGYLKANRIEAGAASYAQVVRLVLGTGLGLSADESASRAR